MPYISARPEQIVPNPDGSFTAVMLYTDDKGGTLEQKEPIPTSDLIVFKRIIKTRLDQLNGVKAVADTLDTNTDLDLSGLEVVVDTTLVAWQTNVQKLFRLKRMLDSGMTAMQADYDALLPVCDSGYKTAYADTAMV